MRATCLSQLISMMQKTRKHHDNGPNDSNLQVTKIASNAVQEKCQMVDSPIRKGLLPFENVEERLADEEALTAIQQPQFVEYLNDLYLNMQSSGKSG